MITCSKIYREIPFAHRQHLHDGQCSKIHGHNWDIKLTFGCKKLDETGFVVDFGKLKYIKKYIQDKLDHACVLSWNDPLFYEIVTVDVYKVYTVEHASCEGIAKHLLFEFADLLKKAEGPRAWIYEIEIFEDSKNSVKYRPPMYSYI
tara:strand:+ start:1433 stop:1873 length:441 start_codon:yes stop_codon:yes gene_type:complete